VKPLQKGKPPKKGAPPAPDEAAEWQAPFSNYAGKFPLGIDDVYASLMDLTGGWPKVISGTLCVRKGQDVRPLKNQAALFAWIRRQHPVDWKRGGGRAVPLEQFYERLLDQDEVYSWASAHPHFPPVPGVYYLSKPPAAQNTGMLDELLDCFCPETP